MEESKFENSQLTEAIESAARRLAAGECIAFPTETVYGLGADASNVQRMVLSEGGRLVLLGLALGVLGALVLSRLMQGLLFGVAPNDPATLAGVALLMAAVGIGACWIPAARAARIDPGVALRGQ